LKIACKYNNNQRESILIDLNVSFTEKLTQKRMRIIDSKMLKREKQGYSYAETSKTI